MERNADPIGQLLWQDLNNSTNIIKGMFKEVEEANTRSLDEDIFVKFFLPLFSGENTNDKEKLLNEWYKIAGTPYSHVNLYDKSGLLVAVVPPILDRNILPVPTGRENAMDLDTMFDIAKQKASLSPNIAHGIVVNDLKNRYLSKIKHVPNPELVEKWRKLLAHFNKSIVPGKEGPSSSQSESDFEYE